MLDTSVFNKKVLIRSIIGLALMAAALYVTKGWGVFVLVPPVLLAVSNDKADKLLYFIMVIIAMTIGNGTLIPKPSVYMLTQRIITLFVAMIMVFKISGRRNSPLVRPFMLMMFYWVYMFLPSTMGWCPIISYMKMILFIIVFFAYYGVANTVIMSQRSEIMTVRSMFLAFASFFILGSILLIPFPGISMMGAEAFEEALRSGTVLTSLYMGMTSHSQMLGPVSSMLGVILFADLLFGVRKVNKFYILLLACVPILIWKTSSRTAMGSFIVGISFVTFFFMQARGIRSVWKGRVLNSLLMLSVVLGLAIICVPSTRKGVANFLLKYNHDDNQELSFTEMTHTRQGKWDQSMYYFKKSPMMGNGFQVSEEYSRVKISNPFEIMSAPVEKGIWISAILEEGGVCGFVLFLIFAITTFFSLLRQHAYIGLAAFFMMFVINLGEFTMFSMSGMGGFFWAIVFVGLVLDAQRLRQSSMVVFPTPMYRG